MHEFKITSSNFSYVFGGLFLLVSISIIIEAIVVGCFTIKTKINSDTYTMASRVEISSYWSKSSSGSTLRMYSPVFFYNVDGKEYSCSTGSASSVKPSLEGNKIFYNSKNPKSCISEYDFKQNCISVGIFFIVALPGFIIGLFVLLKAIAKSNKNKDLAQHGQLIKDIPCKIVPSNITYNGSKGYIIELEYEGNKLKSETKFDIDIRRTTADLLIDPLNHKNYFIGFDIK